LQVDRPEGGLYGPRRLPPVAVALGGLPAAAFVTLAPELVADDFFDDGLERETHRQACYLLQDAEQVAVGREEVMDLCTDGLGRRYSWCHGCRSSFVSWLLLKEPTPVAYLHQGLNATLLRKAPSMNC